jgi:hypothetical protein
MEQDKISPIAIVLTVLFHLGLFYLGSTRLTQSHRHHSPYDVIKVSIPISTQFHPHQENNPDMNDLIVPAEKLVSTSESEAAPDKDRYYLPQELSQQVRVLYDVAGSLNTPIRKAVTMTLYINEAGNVDDVTIDDKGDLTDDEEDQLINGFKQTVFLPGMRGEKVVKSIYRIQLEINRRIIIHR